MMNENYETCSGYKWSIFAWGGLQFTWRSDFSGIQLNAITDHKESSTTWKLLIIKRKRWFKSDIFMSSRSFLSKENDWFSLAFLWSAEPSLIVMDDSEAVTKEWKVRVPCEWIFVTLGAVLKLECRKNRIGIVFMVECRNSPDVSKNACGNIIGGLVPLSEWLELPLVNTFNQDRTSQN